MTSHVGSSWSRILRRQNIQALAFIGLGPVMRHVIFPVHFLMISFSMGSSINETTA